MASSYRYAAGSTISLKAGDTWHETFVPHGRGDFAGNNWITVTSYGAGAKPIIDGSSNTIETGVKFTRTEDDDAWKFLGLSFTNQKLVGIDAERATKTNRNGLWIENCDFSGITGATVATSCGNGSTRDQCFRNPGYDIVFSFGIAAHLTDNVTIKSCTFDSCDAPLGIVAGSTQLVDTITVTNSLKSGPAFAGQTKNQAYWNAPLSANGIAQVGLTFQNFTIDHTGDMTGGGVSFGVAGIQFQGVTTGIIQNGSVAHTGNTLFSVDMVGVDYEGSTTNVTVSNVNIHDNQGSAFLFNQSQVLNGVNDTGSVIDSCTINNNALKTPLDTTFPQVIRANTIASDNIQITNNTITRADSGQKLFGSVTAGAGLTDTPQANWTFPVCPGPANCNTITN